MDIRGRVFRKDDRWHVQIMRVDDAGEVIKILQWTCYYGSKAREWAQEHADVGVAAERLRASMGPR